MKKLLKMMMFFFLLEICGFVFGFSLELETWNLRWVFEDWIWVIYRWNLEKIRENSRVAEEV